MFIAGLVGVTAAAVLAGTANGLLMLTLARVLYGLSAAMLAPAELSLLVVMFTDPHERGKAFGVYFGIVASGAAVGQMLSGALVENRMHGSTGGRWKGSLTPPRQRPTQPRPTGRPGRRRVPQADRGRARRRPLGDCRRSMGDKGPGWIAVLLRDANAVLYLDADFDRYSGGRELGHRAREPVPPGSERAIEVRARYSDELGVMREDPVTGGLNASVAQMAARNRTRNGAYVARQGTRLGPKGRVRIDHNADGALWVGGQTATYIAGDIDIA